MATKPELLEKAQSLGLQVDDKMTVKELTAAIADAEGGEGPDGKTEEAPYFEEWECKITNGKQEKLKLARKKVKITEEEAKILNAGILQGSNTYGLMYFRPE